MESVLYLADSRLTDQAVEKQSLLSSDPAVTYALW